MNFKSFLDKLDAIVAEGKKETKTGVVHKSEPGGYGRKVDVNKPEDKKVEPAVKRGRGRPKKDSDSDTGEVKKWDTDELSRWIVGSKPKTLPGKASVKHKLKDEEVEEGKTGPGLWANIHAKRERIKGGSGEKMRKPGSKGAPTAQNFKDAAKTTKESVAEGFSTDATKPTTWHGNKIIANRKTPKGSFLIIQNKNDNRYEIHKHTPDAVGGLEFVSVHKTPEEMQAAFKKLTGFNETKQGVAEGSINELSVDTLKSYTKKANDEVNAIKKKQAEHPRGHISGADADKKLNRQIGINQATKRIVKKDLTGVAEGFSTKLVRGPQGRISLIDDNGKVLGIITHSKAENYWAATSTAGNKYQEKGGFSGQIAAANWIRATHNLPSYADQAKMMRNQETRPDSLSKEQGVAEGDGSWKNLGLSGEVNPQMGPRLKEIRNFVERFALHNQKNDYIDMITDLAGFKNLGDMLRKSDGSIDNTTYNEIERMTSELERLGFTIASDWKNEKYMEEPRISEFAKIKKEWYLLFKKAINFATTYQTQQGVAEGSKDSQDRIKELKNYIDTKERVLAGGYALSPGEQKALAQARQELKQLKKQGVAEGKQETKTGVVHKAEKGGYGRKVDVNKPEDKKADPTVKRGRGRPKKDSDSDTGEVKKWNTDELSRWIVGSKPKTLPSKASVKHKLKDWMEHVETTMIVESIVGESDLTEVDAVLKDIANGVLEMSNVMNHPSNEAEHQVSELLQRKCEAMANDLGSDVNEIEQQVLAELQEQYGTSLDETNVTMAPVQSGSQQIKVDDKTIGVATNPQTANTLKQAIEKGDVTFGMDDKLNESKNVDYAEKLADIISDYPFEHKQAQDGWGMHENFYHALCDHYWKEGRIPRNVMYGPAEGLKSYVEECYAEDTMGTMEEGMTGAALGGIAGAALTKTPSGAIAGANLGSNVEDALFDEEVEEDAREIAANKIRTPAVFRKDNPVSLSDIGAEPKFVKKGMDGTSDKYWSIHDEPLARANDAEELPESELERALRGSVEEMENSMFENKKLKTIKKQGVNEGSEPKVLTPDMSRNLAMQNQLVRNRKGVKVTPDAAAGISSQSPLKGIPKTVSFNYAKDFLEAHGAYNISMARTGAEKNRYYINYKYRTDDSFKQGNIPAVSSVHPLQVSMKDLNDAIRKIKNPANFSKQGVAETSDYFRRREREEGIMSGKRPARKKAPAQTSDYAKRREQEKKAEQGVAEGKDLQEVTVDQWDSFSRHRDIAKKHLANMEKYEHKDHEKFADAYEKHKKAIAQMKKFGASEEDVRDASKRKRDMEESVSEGKDVQMESWEKELSKLLTEGLTVTTSTGIQGAGDSVSVSATDEHAQTLMKLLQDAGLSGTLSDTSASEPASIAEPASSDEVMSQLSSDESDDMGDTTLSFIKQMISNRNGSMDDEMTVDSSDEEYSDEESPDDSDSEEEEVKEADVEEGNRFTGNLAKARAAGKKEADLDGDGDMEPVREGEQTCNECGELMEEDHECQSEEKSEESEELREWANTPHDDVDDKGFKAEIDFMTKYISGGLNKIKQDQTVMPNTRAKVDVDQSSIAEIIRKLENIK